MSSRADDREQVAGTPAVQIRPLAYPDLPQVIAIERRVFPTPVVAGDVRARAVQAVRHLPGRRLGGPPGRPT